jgi:CcmD family protein
MDTPNTVGYMVAGYVVIFFGLVVYIASLVWRTRNLQSQLKRKLKNDPRVGQD